MSRNSEYQFVSTDTQAVVDTLINAYEEMTQMSVMPASPEKLFILWVAKIIIQERVLNNYTGNQNIPSRAEGENLDALAELYYLQKRPEATYAVATERFYISEAQQWPILVPKGTRVTDVSNSLVWETVVDVYILAGNTYVDTQIQCQTIGVAGNGFAAGQLNTIVDVYDYYSGCENITISDYGSDSPDDDEFYELLRASMDAYTTAGSSGSYRYHALKVSTEIADVKVARPTRTERIRLPLYERGGVKAAFYGGDTIQPERTGVYAPGSETAADSDDYTVAYVDGLLTIIITPGGTLDGETEIDAAVSMDGASRVEIYALMDDGSAASDEIKKAIYAACTPDDVRPLNDYVQVKDPEFVEYGIDLTYLIQSDCQLSSLEIEAAVESAVDKYIKWQSAKLGRDINPDRLRDFLYDAGIKRVQLRSPEFTRLTDGRDCYVPQVAKLTSRVVINGGHEDE